METALRVLTAINEKHHPDVDDVHALRTYAGPQPDSMSLEGCVATMANGGW
jgi:hypothetical protein